MRLSSISIENFRSIVNSGLIRIEPFQAFVGENNAGKSNILKGIDCFLSAGSGGAKISDLFDETQPMRLEAEFTDLNDYERRKLKKYLLGDKIKLFKELSPIKDERTGKPKLDVQYRGYMAEPKDRWLSIQKILEDHGQRPPWKDIAEEHGLMDYVAIDEERVNKASYTKGLERYLAENLDIEYDEPALVDGKAMGIQQNLLRFLPDFFLLPAITDYSDEIDKRSTNTVFRRLMGDLSDRMIKKDPRYMEIEKSLNQLNSLFNEVEGDQENGERLEVLATIEDSITDVVSKLMPTVSKVKLEVLIEQTKELFSRGVELKVDDGILTDVLDKGHGLQRNVVFGLLQVLIKNKRNQLVEVEQQEESHQQSILLAIEEPELYIHPQSQRLIYNVLREFVAVSEEGDENYTDQVVYTTHSPAFVDLFSYEQVAIARKPDTAVGTKLHQADAGILGDAEERKGFQLLNSFSIKHNEMFFSKKNILVEGEQDEIAIIATARKAGTIEEFPEEKGYSIVHAGDKNGMPKFERILNAFNIPFSVWMEMDGKDEKDPQNAAILAELNGNTVARLPGRMEDAVGRGHFGKTFECMQFFSDETNITEEIESYVKVVFDEG